MKKFISIATSLAMGVGVLAFAAPAVAAKSVTTCPTIQGGTITDVKGHPITLGYDAWSYNYEAHMFNGWYDNYSRPDTPATSGDRLMMKWNDAWLSSTDCDNDGKLDRHLGFPTYRGSGAWLTNHASGDYVSSTLYHWDIADAFVMSFDYGGAYDHQVTMSDTGGVLAGSGGFPVGGPYSYTWDITGGSVTGDTIAFDAVYTGGPDAVGTVMHVTGTIAADGSMSGDWSDNYQGGDRHGTWSTVPGVATKVMEACTWSDFIKIVAAPKTAVLDAGTWYTDATKTVVIGPEIWGDFAIIQEVSSDPCGEYPDLANIQSELRSGLGNWKY